MEDDGLEFSIDPFDLLQEHDLLIQRLIRAHNNQEKIIQELAENNAQLSQFIVELVERVNQLEIQN